MINQALPATGIRTGWRLFPWAIGAALLLVIAVNAAMITVAVRGFPGRIGNNGFDLSNQYNAVLAQADRAAALGWVLRIAIQDARPVLRLEDAAGHALAGARLAVEAQRPVGPAQRQALTLHADGTGAFVAADRLAGSGQWDLLITAQAQGATVHMTRRLQLP